MKERRGKFLLALALLMTCAAAGTVAQYQTELGGMDSAEIAHFEITSSELDKAKTADIKLFETIMDSDGLTPETDVAAGKIAPGTSGSTTIAVTNNSDVNVNLDMTFKLEYNGLNAPLEFSTDNSTWNTDITQVQPATTKLDMSTGKRKEITLYWRWAFGESQTATDTAIG
ncbi:MAG: hypothetical protein ACLSD0_15635, partial [Coprobacillus cateniformis]